MSYDERLWKSLKNSDIDGFETLFRRYHRDLYRFGLRFCGNQQLVEDQIQNLFLKIWNSRESLGDVKSVKTYLWTALRRDLITAIKKGSRYIDQEWTEGSEMSFSLSADELIIKSETGQFQRKQLENAIETLSPKQKEILFLRFYEGMSYEEIEDIMSINYQVARNYLSRALQSLREILINEETVNFFPIVFSFLFWPFN